jgi:hypothetical protein
VISRFGKFMVHAWKSLYVEVRTKDIVCRFIGAELIFTPQTYRIYGKFASKNIVGGGLWASSVEISVFPSPIGSMLTTFGFSLLSWGIVCKIL